MENTSDLPLIGITMGDPVGIGPEIIIKLFGSEKIRSFCRPVIIGDQHILLQAIKLLDAKLDIHKIQHPDQYQGQRGTMDLLAISNLSLSCVNGTAPTIETGSAMEKYILCGIDFAMEQSLSGLVTCPITKTAMKLAESKFHGHTELLAHHTGTDNYAMMLAGKNLKVVLATIHVALAQVPGLLTTRNILSKIQLTYQSLKERFSIKSPKIAVAGLNPHSGEDSMFGNEEKLVILPAVTAAQKSGIDAIGPLPPDTVFYQAASRKFDAVICMYHDQGLIPFKLLHFKDGVNTTLGLPIIRTSVDHGTAYDIAWKGIADDTSLFEAVKMAAFQASNRKRSING